VQATVRYCVGRCSEPPRVLSRSSGRFVEAHRYGLPVCGDGGAGLPAGANAFGLRGKSKKAANMAATGGTNTGTTVRATARSASACLWQASRSRWLAGHQRLHPGPGHQCRRHVRPGQRHRDGAERRVATPSAGADRQQQAGRLSTMARCAVAHLHERATTVLRAKYCP
jgi:hypothetical protein